MSGDPTTTEELEAACTQLRAEVGRLSAELVDVQAMLARTVDAFEAVLGLADGEPLTVWRADHGGIPLGTFLTPEAAQECCKDHRDRHDLALLPGEAIAWQRDEAFDLTEVPIEMWLSGPGSRQLPYWVIPQPVMAVHDPDGDE